ncbi:urea-proton symporter dur3 [Nicotiana attenuata]|uniref:Urea-proton symporter dur3 n=1 Tax=Nicotiana attenuata TaxID=49451 RepID=A0A1J6ILD6_NICAT|nr:urea-proton symporter dur3 [Nicotiana attenuata]
MSQMASNCPPFQFSSKYYSVSGDGDSCVRQSSFFGGKPLVNQGVGYSVILGFGAFFAVFTSFLVWLEKRYVGSRHTSEWFNTAGRNIASVIVSQAAAHLVFLGFCFLTNIIVTAMLLLGGSAVVNALTGVNIYAASFLIPLGVIVYTLAGGIKATFLASYIHSVIGGLVFGIINIVGNFGTVFVDNGYWVSAIAARPSSTHKGYLLGGLVWFAVPFSLATSLGLGALALDLPITASEASHGLVPPATAIALMGKGGSILLLTCSLCKCLIKNYAWKMFCYLFNYKTSSVFIRAVTSAGSSELIAVSSLCTYDIYRAYINPDASGKQILKVSRGVVLGFGCFMGILAVVLNKAGVSLGWMYLAMGIFIGSAVLPIAFMLLWRKASSFGTMLGTVCIGLNLAHNAPTPNGHVPYNKGDPSEGTAQVGEEEVTLFSA